MPRMSTIVRNESGAAEWFLILVEGGTHWSTVDAYEVRGETADGALLFGDHYEEQLDRNTRTLTFKLKWDGCGDLDWDPDDYCIPHFCGGNVARYHRLLKACVEFGKLHITHADF
jgi:hypothetical protein